MSAPNASHEPIDWFALICGLLLGLIAGGMIGLSFSPVMTAF